MSKKERWNKNIKITFDKGRSISGYQKSFECKHIVIYGLLTKIKNSIRAILCREDIHLPSGKKGWTIKALSPIREMAIPLKDIDEKEGLWKGHLDSELNLLDNISQELKVLESKLNALGEADEKIKLLRTVPGVGPRLSEAVVAIIDDPHRF